MAQSSYMQEYTQAALTAPGRGVVIDTSDFGQVPGAFEAIIASIDTNVTIRIDYSSSATFASDVVEGVPITITSNKSVVLPILPIRRYAALNFVSETGGTAATVAGNAVIFRS